MPNEFSVWHGSITGVKMSVVEMLTKGFNRVTMGSYSIQLYCKTMLLFFKVCKGMWLLLFAAHRT